MACARPIVAWGPTEPEHGVAANPPRQGTARAHRSGVDFIPGERIGNYRIERDLGTTGSGLLLHARHLVVPRRAFIKVLQAGFATDQSLVVQMLREACILEAIAHPGVPLVYEAGCLQDRLPWFAFEMISGPTLDALLAFAPLPVADVAAILRDIADILERAHHRGVIHRGLRPNRVIITAAGRYPLCIPDWSEAIVHDATTDVRRLVSEASRSYVAPELLRPGYDGTQKLFDGRVDVFSLGVIAHRALTGHLPCAPGLGAEPYAASHERRPDAPRALTALIDSMLALQQLDRPTASEVRLSAMHVFAAATQYRAPAALTSETIPAMPAVAMPPMSPDDLVVLAEQQHFRRPRWTPEIRYGATADVAEDTFIEDHDPDDVMD